MAKRMLVDATHPEETRVVVIHGNRLEEFDFETASRKQLKGNIYLAKVTRVEPPLQAKRLSLDSTTLCVSDAVHATPDATKIVVTKACAARDPR